jgi:hypothetical protein
MGDIYDEDAKCVLLAISSADQPRFVNERKDVEQAHPRSLLSAKYE